MPRVRSLPAARSDRRREDRGGRSQGKEHHEHLEATRDLRGTRGRGSTDRRGADRRRGSLVQRSVERRSPGRSGGSTWPRSARLDRYGPACHAAGRSGRCTWPGSRGVYRCNATGHSARRQGWAAGTWCAVSWDLHRRRSLGEHVRLGRRGDRGCQRHGRCPASGRTGGSDVRDANEDAVVALSDRSGGATRAAAAALVVGPFALRGRLVRFTPDRSLVTAWSNAPPRALSCC